MKTKQTDQIIWKEVAFGNKEYFEILSSGIKEFSGEKDYLSTESVQRTKIKKIESKITNENKPSRANMQPILNSVWFAKMKSTIKVYSFSDKNKEEIDRYILSTGFAGLKFDKEISSEYVKFFFLSKRFNEEKDKLSTGSTQSGINNSFLAKIKISLPFLPNGILDLKEQKRIVSILEKAEALKQKGKNAGDLLDEYLKSIFWEMFLKNKNKISYVKLESVCTKITDGVHSKPIYTQKGVPFISVVNVSKEKLNFDNCKYITERDHKIYSKRCNPEKGDILYTKVGATYGIASLVDTNREFSLYVSVCLIKPDNKKINSLFLKYLMNSDIIKKQADKRVKGIGVPDLHLIEIKSFQIPLPTLPLQQKFAKIVERIEGLKENIKRTNAGSEELFNSLMQKAFRRELVE